MAWVQVLVRVRKQGRRRVQKEEQRREPDQERDWPCQSQTQALARRSGR